MKKLSSLVLLSLALLLSVSHASAQDKISASKRAVINELLEVTGAKENFAKVLDSVFAMEEIQSSRSIESRINDDKSTSPEEKKELLQKAQASSDRIAKRFRDYFTTELNLQAGVEEISISLYDKYFTEDELRDLVAFYKSSTGKKAITVLPKLFSDSMTMVSEKYDSKIAEFVKRITAEEVVQLKKDIEPPSAKPQQ